MQIQSELSHSGCTAIIAGTGRLPVLLVEELENLGQNLLIVRFEGVVLDWTFSRAVVDASIKRLGGLFAQLHAANCTQLIFAGAVTRQLLDIDQYEEGSDSNVSVILPTVQKGDDETFRAILEMFENAGFNVVGVQDILTDLQVSAGNLTRLCPSAADERDIKRAAEIVDGLGALDVGQGAVVAQGLCLATESIQGTDSMLRFVEDTAGPYRLDPNGAKGVLLKAPKPKQDWRVDLPAIGPETVTRAAKAGLAGIVIRAGGVLILDQAEVIRRADELGLFLLAVDTNAAES